VPAVSGVPVGQGRAGCSTEVVRQVRCKERKQGTQARLVACSVSSACLARELDAHLVLQPPPLKKLATTVLPPAVHECAPDRRGEARCEGGDVKEVCKKAGEKVG